MGTRKGVKQDVMSAEDHPHAYGDKNVITSKNFFILGSSPRVWGQVIGIYDMCAVFEDHPHAYGDKQYIKEQIPSKRGSSPRVWGQVFFFGGGNRCKGIIPTRMGTREKGKNTLFVIKDHPHAYGDKLHRVRLSSVCEGSSPRVWGQAATVLSTVNKLGIIPTRMGTRGDLDYTIERNQDHPHAYGDKFLYIFRHRKLVGSSPRVWGQVI